MRIREFDPIELPTDRAREQEPINVVQRGHPAWPDTELNILFDYNPAGEFWSWEVTSPDIGTLIPRQPAEYGRRYRYDDYILFVFIDISTKVNEVTPSSLGSSVDLVALPGLKSPGYGDWLDRQTVDDAERAKLRNAWRDWVIQ